MNGNTTFLKVYAHFGAFVGNHDVNFTGIKGRRNFIKFVAFCVISVDNGNPVLIKSQGAHKDTLNFHVLGLLFGEDQLPTVAVNRIRKVILHVFNEFCVFGGNQVRNYRRNKFALADFRFYSLNLVGIFPNFKSKRAVRLCRGDLTGPLNSSAKLVAVFVLPFLCLNACWAEFVGKSRHPFPLAFPENVGAGLISQINVCRGPIHFADNLQNVHGRAKLIRNFLPTNEVRSIIAELFIRVLL